jgi:hypothetical protein
MDQKMIFCCSKKTMMPSESREDFFIIDLRLVRPSIAESFSLAAEGHCIGGRFLVELPLCQGQRSKEHRLKNQ